MDHNVVGVPSWECLLPPPLLSLTTVITMLSCTMFSCSSGRPPPSPPTHTHPLHFPRPRTSRTVSRTPTYCFANVSVTNSCPLQVLTLLHAHYHEINHRVLIASALLLTRWDIGLQGMCIHELRQLIVPPGNHSNRCSLTVGAQSLPTDSHTLLCGEHACVHCFYGDGRSH
jgi:hypothetical protein